MTNCMSHDALIVSPGGTGKMLRFKSKLLFVNSSVDFPKHVWEDENLYEVGWGGYLREVGH